MKTILFSEVRLGLVIVLAGLAADLSPAYAADTPKPGDLPPWVAPARAARKANPLAVSPALIAAGKQLFTIACEPCHGATGRGDGPAAASLERHPGNLTDPKLWEQTDGALFWKIGEGRSPMPVFQETFNEEQRWQIVIYERTLAPKQIPNNAKP